MKKIQNLTAAAGGEIPDFSQSHNTGEKGQPSTVSCDICKRPFHHGMTPLKTTAFQMPAREYLPGQSSRRLKYVSATFDCCLELAEINLPAYIVLGLFLAIWKMVTLFMFGAETVVAIGSGHVNSPSGDKLNILSLLLYLWSLSQNFFKKMPTNWTWVYIQHLNIFLLFLKWAWSKILAGWIRIWKEMENQVKLLFILMHRLFFFL